jgi:hypothetical protein
MSNLVSKLNVEEQAENLTRKESHQGSRLHEPILAVELLLVVAGKFHELSVRAIIS